MPQKSTNSNDTPFWSIPHRQKAMSEFPLLHADGAKTLPIGTDGTQIGCSVNRKRGLNPWITPCLREVYLTQSHILLK